MMRIPLVCLLALSFAGCAELATPERKIESAGLDRHQKVTRSIDASIQLFVEREGGRRAGSGVIVAQPAAEGGPALVLTAAHLFRAPLEGTIQAVDPETGERRPAKLLVLDEALDAAVLEVAGLDAKSVPLQADARLGDPVWVVSFPWGRRGTFATGVVSQIEGEGPGIPVTGPVSLIDAAVSYGTSGGGVFDAESGELLGIVRGYRTAKVSFPGSSSGSLDLPIAGETTVVPAGDLICLLSRSGLAEDLSDLSAPAAGCAIAETPETPTETPAAPGERRIETGYEAPDPTRRQAS